MLYRVGGVVGFVLFVLWLYAVFDSITAPPERVRLMPKALWVITVLVLPLLGIPLWFAFGRPLPVYAAGAGTTGGASGLRGHGVSAYGTMPARRSRPARGIAPDDDVAFLRSLDAQLYRHGPDSSTTGSGTTNVDGPNSGAKDADATDPDGTDTND